jgi:sulfur carrier protein
VQVIVNREERQLPDGATVADVVRTLGGDPRRPGVAVAVNGEVVRRGDWPGRTLVGGDRVEVLNAVQGG